MKPPHGLRPHDGDLLLSRVLGGLGQGGGGADPVRDVGVDPVGLCDAVAVSVEVGDDDPVAEGQRGDGAAARAHLGTQGRQFVHEAFDTDQRGLCAAGHFGQLIDSAVEGGDALVGRVGTCLERVRRSLFGDRCGCGGSLTLQLVR